MHFGRNRRWFALLSAMLFTLSIAAHGFMLGNVNAKVTMSASAAMTAPGDTMDCDESTAPCDDMKGMNLACATHCASIVAVLSDASPMLVITTTQEAYSLVTNEPASRNGPPDPYPPKPLALI